MQVQPPVVERVRNKSTPAASATRPNVMLGAECLERGASGIGRVSRLVARVLGEQSRAGRLAARAVSFRSFPSVEAGALDMPTRSAHGSRARYLARMHLASLQSSHFIYDFAGMARAHPRFSLLSRPYLLWMHGIELWEDATAAWLERARSARLLVSNSVYTRSRAQRLHAGLEHTRVCWLATEEDAVPKTTTTTKAPTVLILSRMDPRGGYKGHRELIDAWPAVTKAIPDARLLIAGSGPGASVVKGWVARSSARERIELLGFVPEAAMPQLWSRAQVFAMPSRGEGFGIAYIEAMRHGLPVIASIHDAAPEVNLHGETGFNVDLDQPAQLADALIRTLDDGQTLRLAEAGRARWHDHFRYTCFRTRFIPVLDELLATS